MNKNEILAFHCPNCNTTLKQSTLTPTEDILLCTNSYCLFPFDSEHMKSFVFNKNQAEEAYREINILLSKEYSLNTTNSDPSHFLLDFRDPDLHISNFLD